jgi:hypothetical protein
MWDLVQAEITKNAKSGSCRNSTHIFSGKIICGCCGQFFGRKKWGSYKSEKTYARYIFQCNGKYSKDKANGAQCSAGHLSEEQIQNAFILAFNKLLERKDNYFTEYETIIAELASTSDIDRESEKISAERAETYNKIRAAIEENARYPLNQDEYNLRFGELNALYESQKNRLSELAESRQSVFAKRERINMVLEELRGQEDFLSEFDADLFTATVENITAFNENRVVVKFRDGSEFEVGTLRK